MIVSQSSNIKLKIYRNFQNYEEGWGSSSARAVKILLGLLESRSCNAANFCHCTVSQKEKTTLCLAKGLPPYWCPTCTWVQNFQQIRLSLSKILSKSADCNNHNITWFHDKSPVKVANHFSPLWDQMQRDKQIFLPHVIWLFEPWNARKVHQRLKRTAVQTTPIWTNPNWTTPHLD